MNIYKIQYKSYDYDQYDAFIVQATTPKEAKMIIDSISWGLPSSKRTIRLIGTNKSNSSKVLLASFNAG